MFRFFRYAGGVGGGVMKGILWVMMKGMVG